MFSSSILPRTCQKVGAPFLKGSTWGSMTGTAGKLKAQTCVPMGPLGIYGDWNGLLKGSDDQFPTSQPCTL